MTAAVARRRARVYALLSLAFRPPGRSLLHLLAGGAATEAVLVHRDAGLRLAAARVQQQARRSLRQGEEQALLALKRRYAALFAGAAPSPVHPYASFLLEGVMMGGPAQEAARLYREGGMTVVARDLPDHLAVELEFMCYLAAREAAARAARAQDEVRRWCDLERRFLEHLNGWLPVFAARLAQAAEGGLYQALAWLAGAFVGLERQAAGACFAEAGSGHAEGGGASGGR